MHETYSLYKDGDSLFFLQTSFEDYIKTGDSQQCLLKMTGQNCCSSYSYLEVVPWGQLQFTWNWNLKRELWSFLWKPCHGSRGRAVVVQGERHQRSLAIRTEDTATGHVSKLCVKDCLSLKTFIPNFVAFFALLEIVIPCIHKMSFSVTSAKREFTPAIVSLSTCREVDIEQLFTEVEVNRPRYSPSRECGEVDILVFHRHWSELWPSSLVP